MRIVDDTLGMFLCRVLGLLLQFKHMLIPLRRELERTRVERILIQKYFGMGSMLHAVPLIKTLRKNYPNARITFLTTGSYREVLALCDIADDVLLADFRSIPGFLRSCVHILAVLLTTRFDISVDLEFFTKFPMLISLVSRANIRVGLFQRKIRPEGILTHKVYYNFYRHISEIYLAYAARLGIEVNPEFSTSVLPSFQLELEGQLRARFQLDDTRKIIIVNVNAGALFTFRKWPAQNFVVLLKLLLDQHPDFSCLLVGVQSEYDYVDGIIRQVGSRQGGLVNCAGRTTLKELFALIEMAYLIITNDSGPLHIATLYGKNIAAFYGPETPVVYGPVNKNSVIFYPEHLYCSPCMCVYDSKQSLYAETCSKNVCLSTLSPQRVLETIEHHFLKDAG